MGFLSLPLPTMCQSKKHPVIYHLLLPLVALECVRLFKIHPGKRQSCNDLGLVAPLEASLGSLNERNIYSSSRAAFSHFAAAIRWEK